MAKLPSVSSDIPRDLRMFLDRVREAINGTGVDSVVTARQLAAAGIISYSGGTIVPPFGSQLVTAPVRPQNVEASGALANIIVTWDKPNYSGHAYAEIWAAAGTVETPPAIGDAILVGMAPGVSFPHNIGSGAQRWYWVRFVNANGEAGPYQSTDGVFGETSVDPAYMLEVLSGAITESQLYADLGARIDLVDGPVGLANSVAARLAAEATARANEIAAEATARANEIAAEATTRANEIAAEATARADEIAAEATARADEIALLAAEFLDVTGMQSYDNATTYAQYDLVTFGGNIYRATQATTGNTPPNATYWELVGAYASLVGGIVANASAVGALTTRVQDTEDGIDIVASDLTALDVRVTDTESGVSANAGAVAALTTRVQDNENGIDIVASDLTDLGVRVTDTESGVSANAGAVTALTTRVQDNENGIDTVASDLTALDVRVTDTESGVSANAGAVTALTTRVQDTENGIDTVASDLTDLAVRVTDTESGVSANAGAVTALTTRVQDNENGIDTVASDITDLAVRVTDTESGVSANAGAVTALTTRVQDNENGIDTVASDVTALDVRVTDTESGVSANAGAVTALTTRVQDTENGIDTVASDLTALDGRVTNAESGVSANAGAVTALTTRVTTAEGSIASQAGQITALEVGLADLSGVAAYDNAATYAAGDYATYNDKLYQALQATTGNLPTNATYWELLGDFTSLGEFAIANAGAIEALDARVEIAEGTITSQSSAITTLSGTVTNQGLGITANASAITGLTTRVSTAEGAITSQSQSITNLSSDLAGLTGTVGTTATALSNLTTRVTDAEGVNTAQASAITALVTTSGANTAAISAESTTRAASDGELFAQYTVKVDVNGYVSGFGLASTAVDGVPTSDFLVRADSFAIASPSGPGITPSEPFVVRTTATTINGETVPAGVYIKDGFIQNGTITNAKIGDAAIDNAKIVDATITNAKITTLDATKITSGFISADRIAAGSLVAGKLATNSVTAANLQAGSVVASKIEAGAVETSKLRVGDFVNYVENASFLLGDTAWTTGTSGFSITTGNSRSGIYALQRSVTDGTTGNSYNDAQFSAVAGDKFVISAWVKRSAAYAGGSIQIGIRWYTYAGVFISDNQTGIAATTTYQEISGTLTAPANAAYGRVRCRCVSQTAGTAYWDDISLLRKQKGDALIVEGTLSASAVSAGFIDTFELNADNITAGTITADRLLIDGVALDTNASGQLTIAGQGVQTENVAERAITSQTSVYGAGQVFTSTSFIDIASISFSSPGSQQVLMGYDFSVLAQSTANSATITYYELYINGALAGSGSVTGIGGAGTASIRAISVSSRTTVTGTNTIVVRGKRGGTASVSNSYNAIIGVSLFTLEALK